MSTAIEWSLGLPCPEQRDAIVASIVDGNRVPVAAAAADHLRRCPACRAFRDSLRTQRMLVRRVAEQQQEEQKKRARDRRLRAEMTEWVDQELKVRGERDLSLAMWKCAYAMLRLDPSVARGTHHEGGPGQARDPEFSASVAELRGLFVRDQHGDRTSRRALIRSHERTVGLLRVLDEAASASRQRQIELMRVLLDLAEELSPRSTASPVATTRASMSWFHEDGRDVRRFLDQALKTASHALQRGHAIANLAVWHSAEGSISSAYTMGVESIQACSHLAYPRVNLSLWSTAIGDSRQADRFLSEASALVGPETFRARWPWTLLLESLGRCLTLTGATERERNRAVDSTWIAYHRWGGLKTSLDMRLSNADAGLDS